MTPGSGEIHSLFCTLYSDMQTCYHADKAEGGGADV